MTIYNSCIKLHNSFTFTSARCFFQLYTISRPLTHCISNILLSTCLTSVDPHQKFHPIITLRCFRVSSSHPLSKPHSFDSPTFSDPLLFRSVQTVSHAIYSFIAAISIPDPILFNSNSLFLSFFKSAKSMANPTVARFSVPRLLLLHLFLLSLLVNIVSSADSPSPAPNSSADSPTPSPSHVSTPPNPSPANSPQAPTPATSPHPDSPPAPSPETSPSPSPSPSPADADNSGVNHAGVGDIESKSSSGGGMSSGKKAGIAVGVIVAVGVFALGALVYKKRRQNIQRTEYGYAARRELL